MADVDAESGTTSPGKDREYADVAKGYTPFRDGDLLVAKITPCFENGKIAQARLRHSIGAGSTEFHVIRPNEKQVDRRYLLRFLRQEQVRKEGERRMTGSAGQRRVPEAFLANLPIPLPPLDEQRQIAAVLDKVDALRAKRREAIALLDDLTQSVFLDMFGDPVLNPKGFPRKPIGELGRVTTGNTPPRADGSNYGDSIEWIKSDNIDPNFLHLTPAKEKLSEAGRKIGRAVPPGSLLVTCIAGSPTSIGNVAIADREVAFNQQINALTPEAAHPRFLHAQISIGKKLVQQKSTGGMKGLVSKSQFESILLLNPPLTKQHKFAEKVEKIDSLKEKHRAHLAHLDELFASLQQRAFRGELFSDAA